MAKTNERYFVFGELPSLVETVRMLDENGESFLIFDRSPDEYEFFYSRPQQLESRPPFEPAAPELEPYRDRIVRRVDDIPDDQLPTVIIDVSLQSLNDQSNILWDLLERTTNDVLILASTLSYTATEVARWFTDDSTVVGFNGMPGWTSLEAIEIAPALGCPNAALDRAQSIFAAWDFRTEVVEDRVGLVVPRILAMLFNEAAYAVMENVASPSDIDTAVKLGVNYPHGLLEWADAFGLERIVAILDALYAEYGDPRYNACPLLRQYVRAHWTGKESGRGFFEHDTVERA
jgi:3-hydroxybutyryl-CoA dehydrogenase